MKKLIQVLGIVTLLTVFSGCASILPGHSSIHKTQRIVVQNSDGGAAIITEEEGDLVLSKHTTDNPNGRTEVTKTTSWGVKKSGEDVDTNYDTNRKPAKVQFVPINPRRLTGNSMAYPPSAWGL
jgi:hypothetical protein